MLWVRALPVVQEQPRLGMGGHGILDVQIYAMLGREEDALTAFEAAVDEGFRTAVLFSFLPLEFDPYLQKLRDRNEFVVQVDRIAADIKRMRDNVEEAQASGDWAPLRDIAIREATQAVTAELNRFQQR